MQEKTFLLATGEPPTSVGGEKTQCASSALPGLKPGARQSEKKRRLSHQSANRRRQFLREINSVLESIVACVPIPEYACHNEHTRFLGFPQTRYHTGKEPAVRVWLACLLAGSMACVARAEERPRPSSPKVRPPQQRQFIFHYSFVIKDLKPGTHLRVWIPSPRRPLCLRGAPVDQQAEPLWGKLPFALSRAREPKYGNEILYFQTTVPASGQVEVDLPYRITRYEVNALDNTRRFTLGKEYRRVLLAPSRLVPVGGKPLLFLASGDPVPREPMRLGRHVFELVRQALSYRKTGRGWGRGDVLWVCDSRYGNCSDFHSLFLSLMRSQGVPALFQIGFPIPAEKPQGRLSGYHCWAWFFPPGRVPVPVDISEADKHPQRAAEHFGRLGTDRVAFSVGRDLVLVPRQQGEPLNFFIYPYAEIGGQPVAPEHFQWRFRYRELARPLGTIR